MIIEKNDVVLFQGDSITFAGRNLDDGADMGRGYAMMAAALFSATYPDHGVQFINRGIGSNTVMDLRDRWQADCLDLNPSVVSILIGINDIWRDINVGEFETTCRSLLKSTRETTGARFILIEPFLLPGPENYAEKRVLLAAEIDIIRKLAWEFEARLVPADGLFAAEYGRREQGFWIDPQDGVHPTSAGHALLAQAWLRNTGAL